MLALSIELTNGFPRLAETLPQKPQMLRGSLIRLTRGYTDGGMDSHAEEEKGVNQGKKTVTVIRCIKIIFSANGRSAVHVFMREAG
jgi:hypothetical protein